MYGDAWSAEVWRDDHDELYARCDEKAGEDARRVPELAEKMIVSNQMYG